MNRRQIYQSNQPFLKPNQPTAYQTQLGPAMRSAFNSWRLANNVPYDPSPYADYDMPGFFAGLATGNPHAEQGVNANDGLMHYSDYWKTPYHQSFSAESQWADPRTAPNWINDYQLATPHGQIVFDEQTRKRFGQQ